MRKIKVSITTERTHDILIGTSLGNLLFDFIEKKHGKKRVAVITDENVKRLYEDIIRRFEKNSSLIISIPPGERGKTRATKERVENILLENNFGKDSLIIAVGGGVVCDLAGFVASTFNRGVALINVPTTLLAMADASIGGKTAVNTVHGKNLVGAFFLPDAVFIDLNFLDTLPKEEFLNGFAEIVKMAVVFDDGLFEFMENNKKKIIANEKGVMLELIGKSALLKKNIVEKDPEETGGLRQLLNFGHTIGHALEKSSRFRKKHGFCVSAGMAVESRMAVLNKNLKKNDEERIIALLDSFGLPTKIEKGIAISEILESVALDKKSRQQKPRFVVVRGIGKVKFKQGTFSFNAGDSLIKKAIEECKND